MRDIVDRITRVMSIVSNFGDELEVICRYAPHWHNL